MGVGRQGLDRQAARHSIQGTLPDPALPGPQGPWPVGQTGPGAPQGLHKYRPAQGAPDAPGQHYRILIALSFPCRHALHPLNMVRALYHALRGPPGAAVLHVPEQAFEGGIAGAGWACRVVQFVPAARCCQAPAVPCTAARTAAPWYSRQLRMAPAITSRPPALATSH